MEKEEKIEPERELEEWEKLYQEESTLSLEERQSNQQHKLRQILQNLHSIFGTSLVSATKKARGETLSEQENTDLQSLADGNELIDRISGLEQVFEEEFYMALEEVLGEKLFSYQKRSVDTPEKETTEEMSSETAKIAKLPKGFNKWDLKMIKLHESRPAEGNRIWVEYWSLRGVSNIGEILYNPSKDIFYFKPADSSSSSFALSDEHGRKATLQARNYYFRVAQNPPQESV